MKGGTIFLRGKSGLNPFSRRGKAATSRMGILLKRVRLRGPSQSGKIELIKKATGRINVKPGLISIHFHKRLTFIGGMGLQRP